MNPLRRVMRDAKARRQPVDLHLHTKFSIDVTRGNTFEQYMAAGERLGIVPGFLDHFQGEKLGLAGYPFSGDNITIYLDAHDKAKETGWDSYLGLEVDFYDPQLHENWNEAAMEWLDRHGRQFDYLVGTVHDVFEGTITIPSELEELTRKHPFEDIASKYFQVLELGIASRRFHGFAHPDVVYRFCGTSGILPGNNAYFTEPRTTSSMESCMKHDTAIELNLRGLDHPWNSTYPAEPLFHEFKKKHPDAVFFTGSDSHAVDTFERFAPLIRRYSADLFS
jgi:HisJ family histidinol phosphate phosphatase